MTVLTVTLNPAIDQTIALDRLVRGAVHRAHSVRYDAGGKGVNVASCLADWGVPVAVTGLLGRENAAVFEALFAAKRIDDRFVRADGVTRTNIKLVDDEETTDINLPGLTATPQALDAVTETATALVRRGDIAILSGSLPLGCAPDHYAQLIAALGESEMRVILDASGPALTAALAAPVLPFCIKPNRHELAAWAGTSLDTLDDLVAAARQLHARGVALVIVSMGAEGALFLSDEATLVAGLPAAELASTVGAGDAMVAGIAAALVEGAGLERIARLSTAFAVAKIGRAGPHLPDLATVRALADEVNIRVLEKITDTEKMGEVR
ncbi:1-phosphofructokinase [Sphingomonas oleivorans]|uniref:Phosphofructokinase n=1 Tax=Sphingomonas oleivorans TaxID=1735121 RepID=A0A2T5FYJ6_9SPHN|nr:1-phosphofructokinase [Sphingomonas oleivorans]PTQ11564.1 1-phosphofructokinase [Sphingomonas oleivorans]